MAEERDAGGEYAFYVDQDGLFEPIRTRGEFVRLTRAGADIRRAHTHPETRWPSLEGDPDEELLIAPGARMPVGYHLEAAEDDAGTRWYEEEIRVQDVDEGTTRTLLLKVAVHESHHWEVLVEGVVGSLSGYDLVFENNSGPYTTKETQAVLRRYAGEWCEEIAKRLADLLFAAVQGEGHLEHETWSSTRRYPR